MSVFFVLPDFNLGGAQRVIIQIANGLAARGVDTTLYVFSARGPLRSEVSPDLRAIYYSDRPLSAFLQLGAAVRLWRLLRQDRPEAVVSTLYQTNMLLSLVHFFARSRARLLLREANYVSLQWPQSRFYPIIRRIGPFLYRRADWIIVPAVDQIRDMVDVLHLPVERIRCIGNPIIGRWSMELAKETLPEEVSSRLKRPTVLSVGRLEHQKGHDVLIRAFAKHYQQHGGQLLIIGEGKLRLELEQLATKLGVEHAVLMPGFDTNPFKYFRRADLFVLSSRHEGLPNVLIQAMAMGVRCVSTDCPSGPRELLANGSLGRLVPVDDVTALASAITEALEGPPLALPEDWLARYDEVTVLDAYQDAIQGALENTQCAG